LEHIKTLKHEFGEKFIHFDEMTVAEIQAVTNLSEHNAQQAKQREYGEPVLWLADDFSKHNFVERLEEKGAKPIQGGRFLHISGATDKGQAMKWLTSEYQKISQHKYLMTIALGDGQNDIAMLEHADIAVRIASPANPLPQLNRTKDVYTSTAEGPDGWTESIEHLVFNHRF
jgi:mannosyl-3-phosphoglycerate phosphatase